MDYSFDHLVEFSIFHNFTQANFYIGSAKMEASSFENNNIPYPNNVLENLRKLKAKNIQAGLIFKLSDKVNDVSKA